MIERYFKYFYKLFFEEVFSHLQWSRITSGFCIRCEGTSHITNDMPVTVEGLGAGSLHATRRGLSLMKNVQYCHLLMLTMNVFIVKHVNKCVDLPSDGLAIRLRCWPPAFVQPC